MYSRSHLSRDAANWLPSRFSLSVETWRRYGGIRMVFPGACLFREPIWCFLGGVTAHERQEHCRGEPGNALSCGYAPDSVKAEGSPIVDLWPWAFSSYEGQQGAANGHDSGAFSEMHRALDGWMLARAQASPAQGLHHHGPRYLNFSCFCTIRGLEKLLGLVDQN